ncbi:MAG: ATP-binding protein [Proteobacteria bacterium]|nr:ATP-binding protein [Pseudomonadota bacterium]
MAIKSIKTKTFLLLLGMTLSMATLLVLAVSLSFDRGFSRYKQSLYDEINQHMVYQLSEFYQQHGHWQEFATDRGLWQKLLIDSLLEQTEHSDENHKYDRRWKMFKYHALLAADKRLVTGRRAPIHQPVSLLEIQVNQATVGYLRIPDRQAISNSLDKKFNSNMKKWLLVSFAMALLFTLLLSWPISGYFTRPIRRLNQHVKKMSEGEYGQMIDINRADELGRLGDNINHLSQTLQANSENQKTFFADISHDLRTPVSVLRAQIEAIQDGIQKPDEKKLNQLHHQVMTLSLLINDIQDLAGTELGAMQYQKQAINLSQLLKSVISSFSSQLTTADISLQQNIEKKCWIMGDSLRLQQLFNNLLNNSLRYTNAGGCIKISLKKDKEQLDLIIEDSAPGVDQAYHKRLFERLFRPDSDRNKTQGGFGIGLAIAKNIVTAHQGTIEAAHSSLGGLAISIRLPVETKQYE